MNEAVIQDEARPLLEEIGVPHRVGRRGLHTVDTIELAAALALKTLQSGAVLFNLVTAEDVCVHQGRVTGVVANRTMLGENAPIDPIMFSANAVIDATGHDAAVLEMLRRRGILPVSDGRDHTGEGPVDAEAGEAFFVENACEVFPGLWISSRTLKSGKRGVSVVVTLEATASTEEEANAVVSGAQRRLLTLAGEGR